MRKLHWSIRYPMGLVGTSNRQLVWENAFLRYQLMVARRGKPKLNIRGRDRFVLGWLANRLSNWKDALIIIRPETLIRWQRERFSRKWMFNRKRRAGRHRIDREIQKLIRQMSLANPLWGAPRIHGELLKIGIDICQSTVARYMNQRPKGRNQTWKTFIRNHGSEVAAMDFLLVPTIKCRLLYVLVILSVDRRKIVHTAVTSSPTPAWTNQQVREAFPFDSLPTFLIHDNEHPFAQVDRLGIQSLRIGFRRPWENGFVERVIGSLRRECLNHFIVFGKAHLGRVLRDYTKYYNNSRTHLSLDKDSPVSRRERSVGRIASSSQVGGLHRRYYRIAV